MRTERVRLRGKKLLLAAQSDRSRTPKMRLADREVRVFAAQLWSGARSRFESLPRDSFAPIIARRLKGTYDEARWVLSHRAGPPPSSFKRRVLRRVADRHDLRVLVGTGTYKGDTVAALRHRLDRIVSIELSPFYAERARSRFALNANVAILEGDSASVLYEVVEGLRQPALFWLDGHASGSNTARGALGSPVSAEVDVVLRSPYPHVLLIDDARCFDGCDGYPTLSELSAQVSAHRGGSVDISVANDIIQVVSI